MPSKLSGLLEEEPMRKTLVTISALWLAAAGLTGSVAAQESPLRVAIFTADPFGGYCHELMSAIAERAGLEIAEFQPTVVPDMVPAVANGTADVLCSGLGPTTERRQAGLAFTSAILTNQETIVVLADNDNVYRSFADFVAAGAVIGGETGSNFVNIAAAAGVEVRTWATNEELEAALHAGEITGWIRSYPSFAFRQAQGDYADLKHAEGYIPSQTSFGAIAVQQSRTELLGIIQAALEGLKADGALAEMAPRWGLPLPPF
jgi:polar amino acid transport system substrate-binding protein